MLMTTDKILDTLGDYSNPRCRLQRLVAEGEYVPIIRGMYETDPETPGRCLASVIRGPSYLSFGYALSVHGMVPGPVEEFSSATHSTHRSKTYDTLFGRYTYRDIPKAVFGYGVGMELDHGYQVWIAGPEKALCDTLYEMPPKRTVSGVSETVLEELCVYEWALDGLDMDLLRTICPLYRSSSTDSFLKMMERR